MPEDIIQPDKAHTPPLRLGSLHYAWIVAATGSVAMFCGLGLGRFAFGMLLPSMSASLGLNYTQSGILGFTNLIGYLVAVLLSPLIIPRFGTRVTGTASLLLIAASMLGMAFTSSFPLLCALYVLTGIGSGGVVLPMMSVMSHWFFPSHRGLALGLVMAGPGFGIILSGFVVPKLLPFSSLMSWQTGWLIFAIINVIVAWLTFTLIRNHPDDVNRNPFGRTPTLPVKNKKKLERSNVKLLVHLGIIFAIYGATYMVYVTFIVTSMVGSYQLSEATAGGIWAWIGLLSVFSGMLFGWISDHIGRRLGLALAFFFLALAYLLVGLTDWHLGLYLSIILFGLVVWSVPVIMAASAGDYFGAPAAAASALAALTFAFSGGQALGPVAAGYLAELTGDFSISYMVSGIAAFVAIGLALLLRPQKSA
ncbi:YbfB/YjiJ family MFS transporter [Psychrobacter sp. ENNN9_III]|uniref:YbfB/YjiJ family MFS transporter n=1 Tax=Psychrobacter sp. ENNN9_III TaxID=1254334 RepID=UPI00071E6F23|nr:YbfB/YjiJ family MFS transporter [Psychrobacter sp. ENNN9_III]